MNTDKAMRNALRSVIITLIVSRCSGFISPRSQPNTLLSPLKAVETESENKKSGYVPKWVKKNTLADELGQDASKDAKGVGLIGTVPVIFKQGDDARSTMALPGQPLSDVAAQAGQFIRYGCKKGECGTCEALCDGKWIRPCVVTIPEVEKGEEYVVTLKAIKSKSKSSGKFFSVRSFFMGFYNNLLGMVGFVKQRRAARRNYLERMEIEDSIEKLAAEKRGAAEEQDKRKNEMLP